MTSASKLLHEHLGAPVVAGCVDVETRCWVCATPTLRAMPRAQWMGSNFVGQNRVRSPSSSHVCEACVFAMAGKPPDTLRMYSHLFDDRGWLKLNKGDKAKMRAWLREPKVGPWFAAIADSGQKQLIPWTPINPANVERGVVYFEERVVTVGSFDIIDETSALLTAGATKDEIERGDYGARAWTLCGPAIRVFEARRSSERGGAWFALVVWLSQRDEAAVEARLAEEKATKAARVAASKEAKKRANEAHGTATRTTADAHDGGHSRRARRVPGDAGSEPAHALGHDREPDAGRDGDDDEPAGVAHDAGAQSPDRGHQQLGLPGVG